MDETTFTLGLGGIALLIGAGVGYGATRAQLKTLRAWCEKNETEIRRVDANNNSLGRQFARMRGREEARGFKAEETQESKR